MKLIVGIATALACLAAAKAGAQNGNPWAAFAHPTNGAARAIGTYANGCIAGAKALSLDGPGWHVIRPQRNRNWGHPSLVAAVEALARAVAAATGKSLLVADLGQPRGGPVSGHASHQMGLDADIRFQLYATAGNGLDPATRSEGAELSMLSADGKEIDRSRWSRDQLLLLRAAAELPVTDRIFVHPVIKREACLAADGDRRWLGKVVPWYGHDGHLHLRVACPADSPECRRADPLPAHDGCGPELAWWFTDEPMKRRASRRPTKPPDPPPSCLALQRQ